ncbi:MAG: hypothetical protein NTX19_05535 [Gemmatimonadetes bacterium]|nr:hypothetical protein [Gemmatimonadota bacterium]
MSQHAAFRRRLGRATGLLAVGTFTLFSLACVDAKENLLTAVDPDLINPQDVLSPDGANALRLGTLSRLRTATAASDGDWLFGGLLADEWSTSSTFVQNDEADERSMLENNGTVTSFYRNLNQVRTAANQAIAALRIYAPTPASNIAEMYFARAFVEMQLAQDFCSGLSVSDGANNVAGGPLTNDQVFNMSLASYDSAIAIATATDAATVLIKNSAMVGKARAYIGLNNHAAAVALVAAIPTTFTYDVTFATSSGDNILWSQPASSRRYTVGDSLEGNARNLVLTGAIPFFSAKDPRLPVVYTTSGTGGKDTLRSQDGLTFSRTTTLWGRTTSVPIVNGIDARMVEAEAKAKAGDAAGSLAILNALRAAPPKLGDVQATAAQLPPLTAAATTAAAIDQFFREKAFWTFSRGQRLSDVRRLMRQYGRSQASTYPTGQHYRGLPYGTDVVFQVPTDERNNPKSTGCTNRLP